MEQFKRGETLTITVMVLREEILLMLKILLMDYTNV